MTVTKEQIEQEIKLISTGYNGGPAISFGGDWRNVLPSYVLDAWFAPLAIRYASNRYGEYISALHKWYDELKTMETATAMRGLYSIDDVVECLEQCNDELEVALSCVHHYRNNKQINEQIDRLSRNFVALATGLAQETLPKHKVGDKVYIEGQVVSVGTDRVAVDHDGTRILWCHEDLIPVTK